jgi:hypothetical protein
VRRKILSTAWSVPALLLLAACGLAPTHRVYPSAEDVEPLAPGSRVPSARVLTVEGDPVDLAERLSDSGALLVFYRGGW